ncbi:MAG: hypothetical protein VCB42_04815, partial [Myxococcota bacterium]
MGRLAGTLAAGLALLAGLALPAQSREVWRKGEAHVDAGGELRLIGLVSRGTSEPVFSGFSPEQYADCGLNP